MSANSFGPFEGRTWLNAAHQGPLPSAAVAAAHAALADKVAPARLDDDAFFDLPDRLRASLARLIGGTPSEIVLGNSTSYGLHLLAQGLPLQPGDEVLLVDGDFPATVVPWLPLARRGVHVRRLSPRRRPLSAEQLEAELSPSTRVFCASWVFSFTGEAIDLEALGSVCRERGVTFIVNGSQAVGTRPLDVSALPVDALVSCGFKWLCGPYATGFCWLRPELLDRLCYEQAYWLSEIPDRDLSREGEYVLRDDLGSARYDVFCTANFLNFAPWLASIEHLLHHGIARVAAHNQALVGRLIEGVNGSAWETISPPEEPERSTLALLRAREARQTQAAFEALAQAGVDVALRAGSIRFSPHIYNTEADIDRALEVLM